MHAPFSEQGQIIYQAFKSYVTYYQTRTRKEACAHETHRPRKNSRRLAKPIPNSEASRHHPHRQLPFRLPNQAIHLAARKCLKFKNFRAYFFR